MNEIEIHVSRIELLANIKTWRSWGVKYRLLTCPPYRRADRSTCYQTGTRPPPCWSTCTPFGPDFSEAKLLIISVPVFWLVNKDLRECFHKPSKHFCHKKTKALKRQYYLIICEQPSLLLCRLHPEPAGADVVRGLPATKTIIQEIKSSHSACNQKHYSRTNYVIKSCHSACNQNHYSRTN